MIRQSLAILVIAFGLFANPLYGGDGKKHAARMIEMIFERCAAPVLLGNKVAHEGLPQLSEDVARHQSKNSTGRSWVARDAHVTLNELVAPSGKYYGCDVQWESLASKGEPFDHQFVIDHFLKGMEQKVEDGTFVEIKRCGDRDKEFLVVFESRIARLRALRAVLSHISELDFMFLVFAETDAESAREPCS